MGLQGEIDKYKIIAGYNNIPHSVIGRINRKSAELQ